jgi:vitamin B12 transporter
MPVTIATADPIVITASRAPESQSQTPASVSIIDAARIERLGEPLVPALLRLTPSLAVTPQGPAGCLTVVRIRGAENNHTLFIIDGIKINDPASGNIPRFELLNADIASRIEVVRGPQSALWGSEAIGGVIAVNGVDDVSGYALSGEAGSFGFERAALSTGLATGKANLAAALGWQRATGIDSFSGEGDKDGYRNLSGRLRGTLAFGPSARLGVAAVALGDWEASARPLTAITPPMASEPHNADCGPRITSIREARSALSSSSRGVSFAAGSLARMPSMNSRL